MRHVLLPVGLCVAALGCGAARAPGPPTVALPEMVTAVAPTVPRAARPPARTPTRRAPCKEHDYVTTCETYQQCLPASSSLKEQECAMAYSLNGFYPISADAPCEELGTLQRMERIVNIEIALFHERTPTTPGLAEAIRLHLETLPEVMASGHAVAEAGLRHAGLHERRKAEARAAEAARREGEAWLRIGKICN